MNTRDHFPCISRVSPEGPRFGRLAGRDVVNRGRHRRIRFAANVLLLLSVVQLFLIAGEPACAAEGAANATVERREAGPWGRLAVVETYIRPPRGFVADMDTDDEPPQWFINAPGLQVVRKMMENCEIDRVLQERWLTSVVHDESAHEFVISPTREEVLSLPAEVRACWYDVLSLSPQNPHQRYPFRSSVRPGVEWVSLDIFPEGVRPLLSNLLYKSDNVVKFADMGLVSFVLTNELDAVRFKRMVASKRTLLAALMVDPDADIEALVEDWGGHGRKERIYSIIEMASRTQSPWGIPVELLLPPIPRALIYTYQQDSPATFDLDCNWTTYNFFLKEPDYTVDTADLRRDYLAAHFESIAAPTEFGDVIAFLDEKYRVLHICNYIADDLVFTKNGYSVLQPWQLMRLSDLEDYFQSEFQAIQKAYFRYEDSH